MGISCVNGPARCMAPDEPRLYVACSRGSVAWKLHSILIASHKKWQIPLEHLALGLFFKGDNLEGKLSSEELPEFFLHFICMKGDILKKGLLGRFEVAFGWWDLSDWCCCVRRTKVSLTVRPRKKACSSELGEKKKIKLYFLLCCWYFFLVLK